MIFTSNIMHWVQVSCINYEVLDIRHLIPGIIGQVSYIGYQVSDIRNQVSGIKYQIPNVWYLVSYISQRQQIGESVRYRVLTREEVTRTGLELISGSDFF